VTRAAFATLSGKLLDRLRQHCLSPWPLDGVILSLHGAMVAEDEPDAEGALLGRVRALIGPNVPLIAILDSHANLSAAMVEAANLLILYQTYPHVDLQARGREALEALLLMRRAGVLPSMALRQMPLLTPLPA